MIEHFLLAADPSRVRPGDEVPAACGVTVPIVAVEQAPTPTGRCPQCVAHVEAHPELLEA